MSLDPLTLPGSAASAETKALAQRKRPTWQTVLALGLLAAIIMGAALSGEARPDLTASGAAPPSLAHPFGSDPLGRDMLVRTVQGLGLSLRVGLIAALISGVISLLLAVAAAVGGRAADAVVSFFVDMTMGLPHLVLLVLICFALGGGTFAVITSVALTHWPRLARVLRAEMLQVLSSDYVAASRGFGRSWAFIARRHLLPHILPQWSVGTLLLFPHAILHEAGLTFLGFGLEPGRPAIGVMLAESMRSLTAGNWWLGVFPGAALLALVLAFDGVAGGLHRWLSPRAERG